MEDPTFDDPGVINPLELGVFIKEQLKPPTHLFPIVPPQFAYAIKEILQAAGKCFLAFRFLQDFHRYRYYYTCSRSNPIHYNEHMDTLIRLSHWKPQHPGPNDPNLFPTAKLPRFAVQLHPDESQYEIFLEAFDYMKHQFVIGPYLAWCNARRVLDHLLASAFRLLPQPEELMVRTWWEGFVSQIPPWAEMVENLKLPGWEAVMRDVDRKIAEAVDLEGEWQRIC